MEQHQWFRYILLHRALEAVRTWTGHLWWHWPDAPHVARVGGAMRACTPAIRNASPSAHPLQTCIGHMPSHVSTLTPCRPDADLRLALLPARRPAGRPASHLIDDDGGGGGELRACLLWTLNFNKYCNTFVLFNKKFLILLIRLNRFISQITPNLYRHTCN